MTIREFICCDDMQKKKKPGTLWHNILSALHLEKPGWFEKC